MQLVRTNNLLHPRTLPPLCRGKGISHDVPLRSSVPGAAWHLLDVRCDSGGTAGASALRNSAAGCRRSPGGDGQVASRIAAPGDHRRLPRGRHGLVRAGTLEGQFTLRLAVPHLLPAGLLCAALADGARPAHRTLVAMGQVDSRRGTPRAAAGRCGTTAAPALSALQCRRLHPLAGGVAGQRLCIRTHRRLAGRLRNYRAVGGFGGAGGLGRVGGA